MLGKRSLFAALLLLLAGCGGSEVDLGQVTGLVTLDDKPLPGAYVQFVPMKGGRPAGGATDASGRYELTYSATDSGALVGPAKVLITTGDPEAQIKETVPTAYNAKTTLTVDVTPGRNVHDFPLKSK